IKDLVMSRFRHEDYEDYGITGLKVTGVSRIHHRSLRLQFDQILESPGPGPVGVEPDADRAFEHLFYVPEPRLLYVAIKYAVVKAAKDILDAARENVVALLHTMTVAGLEKMEADKKRSREAAETWARKRLSEGGNGNDSKRARP
ncbi:Lrrc9, partial [Symbiodinium sp. KB8]